MFALVADIFAMLIKRFISKLPTKLATLILIITCTVSSAVTAELNVLIIGSTTDTSSAEFFMEKSAAFNPNEVGTSLQQILQGANLGKTNVVVEDRGSPFGLAAWFHYPKPADVETTSRWPLLRGEKGIDWDYVVLIGDTYTIENMPGLYAHGVAMIAEEVSKGGAETILLMPWPDAKSSATIAHYKEVVYRAGRSGPYTVAPAGLAWEAAALTAGEKHPTTDGAFIAASTIFSAIWNKSASASSYTYNDELADLTFTTVTKNNSAQQYIGTFSFQNPFLILDDKRRDVHFSEKGTSTEQDFKRSVVAAMNRSRVTYNHAAYSDKYTSDTPEDDGKGWPVHNPMPIAWNHGRKFSELQKEYVVNPAYWQLGMGFKYHNNTWKLPVAEANDLHVGQILSQDIALAAFMKGQHDTARSIPWRLIWAQLHYFDDTLNPLRDGSGPHQNHDLHKAVGTYMYTLYSGRCPLDPAPEPVTTTWIAEKIGYETAWRLGRCQTRAPGFKVMPSDAKKKNLAAGSSEEMTVQFILPPRKTVTVTVSLSNPGVAKLSATQLTFTPENYKTPQKITCTAISEISSEQKFDIVYTTASDDDACNNVSDSWRYSVSPAASTTKP